MKRALLILVIALPFGLGVLFIDFLRKHHTPQRVATVPGSRADSRMYELLSAKNGDLIFRPVDRSWSAEGRDHYGRTDVTAVRWRGPRQLTLELGHEIVMEVDGDQGTLRYSFEPSTKPATIE